jgi:hypothetical protein
MDFDAVLAVCLILLTTAVCFMIAFGGFILYTNCVK